MSKISIKTDFQDGTILPASDLNNNFRVIQAGVNANEETLQEVIDEAIIRLDNELIEITADRGWDWNGGDRVTFYKGDTDAIEARDKINGQLLYNIETGETAVDDDGERITTGSGNVVAVTETEPENPATKLWIKPGEMVNTPIKMIDLFYPIGSYYETSNADFNPNVAWGGTWTLDSAGKVTVAYDGSDTDFDVIGETGGEKTHTLTIDEMPSHNHSYYGIGGANNLVASSMVTVGEASGTNLLKYVENEGGGQAHNILQPYIVVNRWHRTA